MFKVLNRAAASFVGVYLISFLTTTTVTAQDHRDENTNSDDAVIDPVKPCASPSCFPYWPNYFHEHNRAIGFGSLAIEKSGSDPSSWKKLEAFTWATASDGTSTLKPIPVDTTPTPSPIMPPVPNHPTEWELMITTHYELVECPNGEAFIARSGIGASKITPTSAQVFNWGEGVSCGATPFPGGDKNRPLDLKSLKKELL